MTISLVQHGISSSQFPQLLRPETWSSCHQLWVCLCFSGKVGQVSERSVEISGIPIHVRPVVSMVAVSSLYLPALAVGMTEWGPACANRASAAELSSPPLLE